MAVLHTICAAADRASINAQLDGYGWGPNNMSVPLTSDGIIISHYGSSGTYTTEQATIVNATFPSADVGDGSLHTFTAWILEKGLAVYQAPGDES